MSTARKLARATTMLAEVAALLAELQAEQEEPAGAALVLTDVTPAEAWVPQFPTPPEPEQRPAVIGKDWIEAGEAANRFGVAKDTIRFWCRLKPHVFGIKRGGRWYVSTSALKTKLGLP